MPGGDALLFLETDTEQAGCNIKACFDDLFELQIWLEFRLIKGKAFGTELFGVKTPVPRRYFVVMAVGRDQTFKFGFFFMSLGTRLVPDWFQQVHDGLWRLGHGVIELVCGKVGIAEQMGLAFAQFHHFAHDLTVVGLAAIFAALAPGVESLLAQFTIFREGQEWFNNRA